MESRISRLTGAPDMKVWLDIENPPQVQYLLPLKRAFEAAGIETLVTARDYGVTLALLEQAGVKPFSAGTNVGRSKIRKVSGVLSRSRKLSSFVSADGRPDAAVGASRAAEVAAWRMRIPSFQILDYEHVSVGLCRVTGATLMHPEVIDQASLRHRGLRQSQLVAFKGIKEDLTFNDLDINAVEPHDLGISDAGEAVRVLFRPPSETSHYYRPESSAFARATLEHLARADVQLVFSPRSAEQSRLLTELRWQHVPVVLDRPVPFVSLLKSVDLVVCSGGTMLREAAYLGIPAYSIFQSEIGAVDRWLERIGRARLISGSEQLGRIDLVRRGPLQPLDSNRRLADDIVNTVRAACRAGDGLCRG